MDEVVQDSFAITRIYDKCPEHVWSAWSDPAKRARWMRAGDPAGFAADFRVGGQEVNGFTTEIGRHENRTVWFEIAEGRRAVCGYSMSLDGRVHSVSVATVELYDQGGGTRMEYREQITVIGDSDGAAGRRHGWEALLDGIEPVLAAEM